MAPLGIVLVLLCGVGPASAHMGADVNVRVVLDEVPAELHELNVQLVTLVAPELRVTNPTDIPLEVLDAKGVPFVSIGPRGVLGNLNTASWYTTLSPSGRTPVPENARQREEEMSRAEPRWDRITPQRSWGWFDHRLQRGPRVAPPEVVNVGLPANLGSWSVPVRYGGKTLKLSGRVMYQPVRGVYEYSLDGTNVSFKDGMQQAELDNGLTLSLRTGGLGEIPTLMLRSTLPEPVTVYGVEDEPFLGFRPGGVRVNRLSPTWLQIQRVRGQVGPDARADPVALPEGTQVSDRPEFEWPALRALYGQPEPPENVIQAGRPVDVLEWWVRFTIGDNARVVIAQPGKTRWVPTARKTELPAERADISAAVVGGGLAVVVLAGGLLFVLQRRRRTRRNAEVRAV